MLTEDHDFRVSDSYLDGKAGLSYWIAILTAIRRRLPVTRFRTGVNAETAATPGERRVLASAPYTEVAGEGYGAGCRPSRGRGGAGGRGEVGEQRITLQCCLATRSPAPGRTATV